MAARFMLVNYFDLPIEPTKLETATKFDSKNPEKRLPFSSSYFLPSSSIFIFQQFFSNSFVANISRQPPWHHGGRPGIGGVADREAARHRPKPGVRCRAGPGGAAAQGGDGGRRRRQVDHGVFWMFFGAWEEEKGGGERGNTDGNMVEIQMDRMMEMS